MKLIEKIDQIRRDFKGRYKCEGCNYEEVDSGLLSYDDSFFHINVIPEKKCPKCGESSKSLGIEEVNINTKYPDSKVV